MRRIARVPLTKKTAFYLARKQGEVDGGSEARKVWESARRTKTMREVARSLSTMTGRRQRCMYCEDSRATQIDHFWPMARFSGKTFVWPNMLWLCGGCNQTKGDRFDLDKMGKPLLIDPTTEDPWDYLFFDPHTGIVTARVDPDSGLPDPKGQYTADSGVLPINIEPVTDGRARVYRSLRRAVQRFLDRAPQTADRTALQAELLEEIRDHDDYGLARWYFRRDGRTFPPFSELRNRHEDVWQAITAQLGLD